MEELLVTTSGWAILLVGRRRHAASQSAGLVCSAMTIADKQWKYLLIDGSFPKDHEEHGEHGVDWRWRQAFL